MKKLNITKKQYDESKYFNKKYGALKFVSESGKLYKTDKGVVIALEGTAPEQLDEGLAEIGSAIKKGAGELADKVKGGLKKAGKAIGDAWYGLYRKNDRVTVKGKAGEIEGAVVSADPERLVIRPDNERSFDESNEDEDDKKEITVDKEDLADALQGVIDTVKDIAADNDVELPGEDDAGKGDDDEDDDEDVDDDEEEDEDDLLRDGELELTDEEKELLKKECGGNLPPKKECTGSGCTKESTRRARRARLVREAIARRARARKVRESVQRRLRAKKVLESIRQRRRAKVLESLRRRRTARKVMESIRKRRALKRVMESRKARFARRRAK